MLELDKIDKHWTLFLDRDGVINEEKKDSYVFGYEEFHFLPGVLGALKELKEIFGNIIMVTNQRGIGRGLMTDQGLSVIHDRMMEEIQNAGGRLDKIYYCPANDNADPERKPNPGMAFRACREFPSIDLAKSVIVGNNLSDMEFGKNAGMYTVHVRTTHPEITTPHSLIDLSCKDLKEFADMIRYSAENLQNPHQ